MIKNKKGLSIIEILISIGLLSIVIAGSAAMFTSLRSQLKFLEQKMSQLTLEKSLFTFSSNADICKKAFSEINVTYPVGSIPSKINLNKLYASETSNLVLAEVSKPYISTQPEFFVSEISLNSITPINTNDYAALLEIKSSGSVIQLKPTVIRVLLKTTTSAGQTTFDGCFSSSALNNLAGISCTSGKYLEGFDGLGSPICKSLPSGGGGGGGGGSSPPSYTWIYSTQVGSAGPVVGAPKPSSCNVDTLGDTVITYNRDSYVCAPAGGCCAFCGNWSCVNQGETMVACHTWARCSLN